MFDANRNDAICPFFLFFKLSKKGKCLWRKQFISYAFLNKTVKIAIKLEIKNTSPTEYSYKKYRSLSIIAKFSECKKIEKELEKRIPRPPEL